MPRRRERAGINVPRIRVIVFTISGAMAAIGGIIFAAQVNSVALTFPPGNLLLNAIAAAVIGGVSLFGGRGEVRGALLGAVLIGTLQNGLNTLNVSNGWIYIDHRARPARRRDARHVRRPAAGPLRPLAPQPRSAGAGGGERGLRRRARDRCHVRPGRRSRRASGGGARPLAPGAAYERPVSAARTVARRVRERASSATPPGDAGVATGGDHAAPSIQRPRDSTSTFPSRARSGPGRAAGRRRCMRLLPVARLSREREVADHRDRPRAPGRRASRPRWRRRRR